ncbi:MULTISPECIES: AraC family transcriptional regulator [Paraburkholderia]|uniref:AraC family transcriptional regulator n=1 Tax=Paraburkholderia TaxID=1822464 RepID=UPI00225514C4|nr:MULTISPECIES: AraC family transcriptional regulator [Paraburkholderia]MCX4161480.1 AraC family transcriptional regulator [Paraburkholderia megapolitana]MDN7156976.1 AraC family transcriptional regulator [Paraburkholderia sp. CHISQ3]MDQ6494021.1 AraC family transcriptional regulator [Paraburkholderia megapolitana]
MDTLSRLIDLARPQASLDLRCLFAGPFVVEHEPEAPGIAPFHLVLDGECVVETAQNRAPLHLRRGDFLLFARGGAHRLRDRAAAPLHDVAPFKLSHDGVLPLRHNGTSEGTAELDLLCGRFVYTHGPAALLLGSLPDPLHVSLPGAHAQGALQTLIAMMRSEAERREPGALAIVTALSHALLALALRAHSGATDTANPVVTPGVLALLSDARLRASVEAMMNEPERAWTIATLGEVAAMSRATYARHFNERAGVTVMDFLTHLRMAIASDLLLRTQRSAADIGMAVGYQSEAAFGKAFQQSAGITPGRYRRQQKEGG